MSGGWWHAAADIFVRVNEDSHGGSEHAVRDCAERCDLTRYQHYVRDLSGSQLSEGIDKPVIVGEFHTGLQKVALQEERGKVYRRYVKGVVAKPQKETIMERGWITKIASLVGIPLLMAVTYVSARSSKPAPTVQRFGSVVGLREEKLEEYKKLHAAVWPEVAKRISKCNLRNYSIYLHKLDDGNYYLFSYFEYVGKDFKADMAKMAADPDTQRWWKVTNPCQKPLENRKQGEWWASMEEVFHQD